MHAPQRISVCAALGLAWAGIASAADALADCRGIPGDAARLACYDALADRQQQLPQAAAAATAVAAPAITTPPAASPEELFGRRSDEVVKQTTGTEQLDELTAKVTGVRAGQTGKLTLSLDNGQVWSQVDTVSVRIKPGEEVRIRRGMLGSYLLSRSEGGAAIRVHRTR